MFIPVCLREFRAEVRGMGPLSQSSLCNTQKEGLFYIGIVLLYHLQYFLDLRQRLHTSQVSRTEPVTAKHRNLK